ncbi:serine hydrolase domain-containing protein [Streptomyces sp. NRRL F-4474]|uniref:serine hydrolase domain-containing protein n=1 Tax=Streptomyces sp. NRRL F-4474 TaxID=1463851 RepID=UPI000ABA37E0|nr:serine hydrolase domain-containing protein [Streptomyces sp. NRRL F-4474]
MDELVAAKGGPPGVIAVMTSGSRVTVHRSGVADIETSWLPQVADHMRIAGIAKAFSGAVALRLVDGGKLDLDDTLGERLPFLPSRWHAVTLRQLLNHTSGLPDYARAPAFQETASGKPRQQFASRRLLDFVINKGLLFPPGTRYAYSNSDSIAVALMAEAVTGRRYEDLLETFIHQADLRHTSVPQGPRTTGPFLHGYRVRPPAPPQDVSEPSGIWSSEGIMSTPEDLTRFIRGYAGGALISEATRKQQLSFVSGGVSDPAGPGTNDAGLAIFRYTTRCGVVYGHAGRVPGYTQLAVATPDGRRSLTFSVNSDLDAALQARVRAIQENFVCTLLNDQAR